MSDIRDLEALIRAGSPIIVIETVEEMRAFRLMKDLAQDRRLPLYRWSASTGLTHVNFQYSGDENWNQFGFGGYAEGYRHSTENSGNREHVIDDTGSVEDALRYIEQHGKRGLYVLPDMQSYLEDPVVLRLLREIAQNHATAGRTLVLTAPSLQLPPRLARLSANLKLSLPDEKRIREILEEEFDAYLRNCGPVLRDATLEDVMVRYVSGLCEEDVRRLLHQSVRDDGALTREDLQRAVRYKQKSLPGLSLETGLDGVEAIGGLKQLRRWLSQRKPVFLGQVNRPGLPAPKGVLIMGVQGCGKSLAAKATAVSWGLPLLRLDIAALYDKFQGETERKLREALSAADGMQPVVLWVDEIEKGVAGDSGDNDGGVSRRMLGTLLTWMAERRSRVFIVATANDVQALPPELVRKGRFDELFFVDLPDAAARATIFHIHLQRQGIEVTKGELVKLVHHSNGMSGAEIEQAIVSSLYECLPDNRTPDAETILNEIRRTRPLSVMMAEKIGVLRAWAAQRCVPAD